MFNKIVREAKNVNNIAIVGLLAFAILSFVSLAIGAGMVGIMLSAVMAGAVCVYQLVDRPDIPSHSEAHALERYRSIFPTEALKSSRPYARDVRAG